MEACRLKVGKFQSRIRKLLFRWLSTVPSWSFVRVAGTEPRSVTLVHWNLLRGSIVAKVWLQLDCTCRTRLVELEPDPHQRNQTNITRPVHRSSATRPTGSVLIVWFHWSSSAGLVPVFIGGLISVPPVWVSFYRPGSDQNQTNATGPTLPDPCNWASTIEPV